MDGIDEETQMVPEDEEMNENEDYELLFGTKQDEGEEEEEERQLSRIV